MTLLSRCLLVFVMLWSACSKKEDSRAHDAGAGLSGGTGAAAASSGAGSNAGHGGAGAAAESGGTGSNAGQGGAGAAAESGGTAATAADGCDADCEPGERCELVQVTCVRAPCPPLPMCVPDDAGMKPAPIDCDPRKILCKRAAPQCPELQVPSVEGSCYGDCVDVHACQCAGPEACPLPEKFTCNMSAKHCTPYLR